MQKLRSPLSAFLVTLLLVIILAAFGPVERTLGTNVRLVYLHGAWVWTSLLALAGSALMGLPGAFLNHRLSQRWALALGQTGMLFWITYLPMSIWTMQANWNGLYLAEPRFRIGLDYAVIGILLQAAILIVSNPRLSSVLDIAFFTSLAISLTQAEQVMHPSSPILTSESLMIRTYFIILLVVSVTAGLFLTLILVGHRTDRTA